MQTLFICSLILNITSFIAIIMLCRLTSSIRGELYSLTDSINALISIINQASDIFDEDYPNSYLQ